MCGGLKQAAFHPRNPWAAILRGSEAVQGMSKVLSRKECSGGIKEALVMSLVVQQVKLTHKTELGQGQGLTDLAGKDSMSCFLI